MMNEISSRSETSSPLQGAYLRELRKRCGWSQEELAERAGLSDRSIRNAEAGRPIHLRSIRALCDVFNGELLLSLSPAQLLESPPLEPNSIQDPAKILETLINCMFDDSRVAMLDRILAQQVVLFCELGVLVGRVEVRRRISALNISHSGVVPDICGLFASGQFASASWKDRPHGTPMGSKPDKAGHGSICICVKDGLVVEAWDFRACNNHSKTPSSVPANSVLSGALGVHGELVRAKRLAEAMTQEDLANRSGLSLRLIRMAENGKSISLRSRQLLSRALSLPLSVIENKSPHAVAETVMGRRAKEFLEEIWNHANYDVIDTHLTRRFRFHHEVGIAFDRAEMKMRIQQFRQSFDHFDFEVTSTLDFGSFVVCKWHVQMTHTGTWFDVAPTGVRVAVHGASWVHVVGKQFGDAWDFWNPGLVLARLRQA